MEESEGKVSGTARPHGTYLTSLVFACGLGATALAAYLIHENAADRNDDRFMEQVFQIERTINTRIDAYTGLLRGGAALFAAQASVGPREFRDFYNRLNIDRHYPGLQGFGYTLRIPAPQLEEAVAAARAHLGPDFKIWPEEPREEYHAIVYLEPLDTRNKRAIGYDMFTEATRREAMAAARDSGNNALSGKVRLVQEGEATHPGFLLYVPVYRGGRIPASIGERRARLQGFVYAPFRAGDLFEAMLRHGYAAGLRVVIWDGTKPAPEHLLYETSPPLKKGGEMVFRAVRNGGRTWTIGFQAGPGFNSIPLAQVLLVPMLGLLASGLLAYMTAHEARARDRLAGSEELHRVILETAADGVLVMNGQGQIVTVNRAVEEIFGYTRAELIGSELWRLVPERDRKEHAGELQHFFKTGQRNVPWSGVEWTGLRKDGVEIPLELSFGASRRSRQPIFTGLVRDISARKEAERRIQETEERFASIARLAEGYAITTMGPGGAVTTWNPGAEHIFGYRGAEAIGCHFSLFFTPEENAAGAPEQLLRQTAEAREIMDERWQIRRDGTRFWSAGAVICLKSADGAIRGYARILRDLTERKQEEERARELNQELEHHVQLRTAALMESTQSMEAFTYTVAHDLRAPLRAMQGFAQALRDDYDAVLDAPAADYLARIMRSAEKMDSLIRDLLAYSQLTRSKLAFQPLVLRGVAEAAISEHRSQIRDSGAELAIRIPEISVLGHYATLRHALSNLIGNALKFARAGKAPWIEIDATAIGERVRISIRDHGIGIAPEHQDRIFRVFERLHGDQAYPGTGIGLAIVKKGIERMGGTVGVASEPGQGSVFWVELPRAEH